MIEIIYNITQDTGTPNIDKHFDDHFLTAYIILCSVDINSNYIGR